MQTQGLKTLNTLIIIIVVKHKTFKVNECESIAVTLQEWGKRRDITCWEMKVKKGTFYFYV